MNFYNEALGSLSESELIHLKCSKKNQTHANKNTNKGHNVA
jgi:hypothetical protein